MGKKGRGHKKPKGRHSAQSALDRFVSLLKGEQSVLSCSARKVCYNGYRYRKKLRSSHSFDITMSPLVKDGEPDLAATKPLISAIQELVVQDVVKCADEKMNATKAAVTGAVVLHVTTSTAIKTTTWTIVP